MFSPRMFPSSSRQVFRRLVIPTAGLTPGAQAVFNGLNLFVDLRATVRVPGEPNKGPLSEERDEM